MSVIGFGAWEAGGDTWGANESEDSRDRRHAGRRSTRA